MTIATATIMKTWRTGRVFGVYMNSFSILHNKKDRKNKKAYELQLEEAVDVLNERFKQDSREIRQYYRIITGQVDISEKSKYDARTKYWQAMKEHFYRHILG